MTSKLAMLHTTESNVRLFDKLLAEMAPDIPLHHVLRADLLDRAQVEGGLTQEIRVETGEALMQLAREDAPVVLLTCSTLGPAADTVAKLVDQRVLRVDRPMIERALAIGPRITIAACVATTIAPTRALLDQVAREQARSPEVTELPLFECWPAFQNGDVEGYWRCIAGALQRELSKDKTDVVVLAQASMAGALDMAPDLPVPVLASPKLGAEAAIDAFRSAAAS